jgi:hypothetical protein
MSCNPPGERGALIGTEIDDKGQLCESSILPQLVIAWKSSLLLRYSAISGEIQ